MKVPALKVVLLTSLVMWAGISQAASVISCASQSAKILAKGDKLTLDHGDAPDAYGEACHDSPYWQRLGTQWDSETSAANSDPTDDGVLWQTLQSDGTWSDYSNTASIEQGATVRFQFSFTRNVKGTGHTYDQLKAWVDWNQDFDWSDSGELLKEYTWQKNMDSEGNLDGSDVYNNLGGYYNSDDLHGFFYQELTIPLDAVLGDTWMRARVACSESIQNNGYGVLSPTGYLFQGEVEDYLLTITKKTTPSTEVPEPSILAAMLSGLILIGFRRKSVKKS